MHGGGENAVLCREREAFGADYAEMRDFLAFPRNPQCLGLQRWGGRDTLTKSHMAVGVVSLDPDAE